MDEPINLAMARRIKELERELERERFMHKHFFQEWSAIEDEWCDLKVENDRLKRLA